MNLVADNEQMVLVAEVGELLKGLLVPGDTTWIMRVAKNEDLALFIANFLQIIEVHLVISILSHLQWVENHLSSVALWGKAEGMINGWLDDDFLIGLGKDIYHESDAFYDARDESDPLLLNIPLMMVANPVDDARQIIVWLHGVAEERMFQSCLEGIGDE